jgi:antitoxin ParD1/3/4
MSTAEKISITVTPEMNRIIKQRVEAGEFASSSELIREAFRAWHKQDEEYRERLAAVKRRIKRSIDDPRPSLSTKEARAELARHARRGTKAPER